MRDFRKLKIWEQSHAITLKIYAITKSFPKEELYGIVSQMRRSAVSIPTNIAEGCGKSSDKDFARYLGIAMGSASELEYQILLSKDLLFLDEEQFLYFQDEIVSIKKQIYHFIQKVNI
jgi:four helix bundle protein